MILIGEKLNSSIPKTMEAFQQRDEAFVTGLITAQGKNSDYLDINTAMCSDEMETMKWVIGLALEHSKTGIMIDSANPSVMKEAVGWVKGRDIILNSLTLTQRFEEVSSLAVEYGCKVVALPIDDEGIPENAEKRVENAVRLVEQLKTKGIREEDIFLDVLAETLAVQDQSAQVMLKTIGALRGKYQDLHLTCGLSNASFGLPMRKKINEALLVAAMTAGLDSAICDTASDDLILTSSIGEILCGMDEYCMNFISKVKNS